MSSQIKKLDQETVNRIAQYAIEEVNTENVNSPALSRLIQDIQEPTDEFSKSPLLYNRVHNRHNRGR